MSTIDPFDAAPEDDPEDAGGPSTPVPDELRKKHDELLERMQTPEAKRAMQEAFDATPEELGRAAVEAARKRSEEDS